MTWQRVLGALAVLGAVWFVFTDPVGAASAVREVFGWVGTGFSRFATFLGALT